MRKIFIFGAAVAALVAVSCSKTEVSVGTDAETAGQKLIIGLSSGSDALTVKSGRPLLSEAAGQEIQNIDLYFVTADGTPTVSLVKKITPAEWENALPYGTTEAAGGMKLEVNLKGSNGEALTDGAYTVYAVGYSTDDAYTHFSANKDAEWDATKFYSTTTGDADEVFAGEANIWAKTETTDNGSISYLASKADGTSADVPQVVLNRQVAGITGYFTNIPAEVNGVAPAKLRLIASKKYSQLNFIYLDPTKGGTHETVPGTVNYVVNGSKPATKENLPYYASTNEGYKVYEIDLAQWFKFGAETGRTDFSDCDINGDGVVGYLDALCYVYNVTDEADLETAGYSADTWATDYKGENGKKALSEFWQNYNMVADQTHPQQLVAGSVFAGKFVIPFDLTPDVNTLELQLLDAEGKVLTNWNVQNNDLNTTGSVESATGVTPATTENAKVYNIYRNHMYSLGTKGLNVDPDEEDPENPDPKPEPDPDPDPDPDQPQDLQQRVLQIHVNDRWEIIHDMVID